MRFKNMINGLTGAMLQYCMEQEFAGDHTQEELERIVSAAYSALSDLPDAELKEYAVYSYHFFTSDGKSEEIFPEYMQENGLLYNRAIHLATIPLDCYTMNGDVREINSAYDLIFDLADERIHLLYRLMIADSDMTTIYRVETAEPDDFDTYEFVMCLVAQLYEKVKHHYHKPEQVFFHDREVA